MCICLLNKHLLSTTTKQCAWYWSHSSASLAGFPSLPLFPSTRESHDSACSPVLKSVYTCLLGGLRQSPSLVSTYCMLITSIFTHTSDAFPELQIHMESPTLLPLEVLQYLKRLTSPTLTPDLLHQACSSHSLPYLC